MDRRGMPGDPEVAEAADVVTGGRIGMGIGMGKGREEGNLVDPPSPTRIFRLRDACGFLPDHALP